MRRRLVTYIDALFVGMILGLLFVSLAHASTLRETAQVHTHHWSAVCNHIQHFRW